MTVDEQNIDERMPSFFKQFTLDKSWKYALSIHLVHVSS